MACANATTFVKIHSLTSPTGKKLNDATGRLGTYSYERQRYEVNIKGNNYLIKVGNMYRVSEEWLREVRGSSMRGNLLEMMSNFDAPGLSPCSLATLRQASVTLPLIESWWGNGVYPFIRDRMEAQRYRRGYMNSCMDDAIRNGSLMLAAVYSDGGRQSQMGARPLHAVGYMHWPTIVYPLPNGEIASYCQGLALQEGARAWPASPESLVIFGPYDYSAAPPPQIDIPSTVQIEEVEDDDSESSWSKV